MLLVLNPSTIMNVSIGIISNTSAVGFSIIELTLVSALIWVHHDTCSLDLILNELSLVDLTRIGEVVLAFTMELAIYEISFIGTSLKLEFTLSSLLSLDKVSSVLDLVEVPDLGTFALLEILNPFTLVETPFGVNENTLSVCFTFIPLALVDVTVSVSHSSLAIE